MKMPPIRVLSVDFDYFIVNKTKRALMYYPDGQVELPPEIEAISWAGNYASAQLASFDMRSNIVADAAAARKVQKLIEKQYDPFCIVADSHRFLYDFIKDKLAYFQPDREGVAIWNIDQHHDSYVHSQSGIHCGNWLYHLMDEGIVTEAHWLRPEQDKNETPIDIDPRVQVMPTHSLDELCQSGKFDLIGVFRSGSWVPPHLDDDFINFFAMPLAKNKKNWECRLQEGLLQSRFADKELKNLIQTLPPFN